MEEMVYKKAIGDFPAIPAPDETWRHVHADPPPIGKRVEVCWARQRDAKVEYQFSTGQVRKHTKDRTYGDEWLNKNGLMVVFNPDFWRELGDGQ